MAKRGGRSGRKYVRDSIGRFATTGATARGGRLKTKSGKKRATQTVKAKTNGKPGGTLKAKPRSEGQKYAKRVQAGKDLKRSQSTAREKKFFAETQKRLDAAPLAQSRAAKPANLSARDAATARLKIKTATRRKLRADRSSVIPANPKARRVQGARISSTVAKKARAKGNAPATIANRIKRKSAVNKANLKENTRYGNVTDSKRYMRQVKTSTTLDRAQNYLKTGQKGKPTEKARRALLAAKRAPEMAAAMARLNAKRADRARAKKKSVTANSARATGKLARPVAKGNIRRTGGRLGPKNTIKPGPKSPRTKMNRAIDNVIKKGKALKGSAEKLRGVKKQADALRGRMLKEDKGRLGKALSKPSVTDKRSRDYGGRLTKGARGQDPATGGKKGRAKAAAAKPAVAKPNLKRSEQMSQKEKWAVRAERRRTQATKAEANAKRLRDANRKVGDNAFWTQPGLGKQRDKARAGLDKSFKELERAKKLRSRADNLERMSKRNKGDAASRQQLRRDKFDSRKISKGQTVNSTLYGPVKVLRVNKKTVTISLNGGKPFTEDKSRFREAL